MGIAPPALVALADRRCCRCRRHPPNTPAASIAASVQTISLEALVRPYSAECPLWTRSGGVGRARGTARAMSEENVETVKQAPSRRGTPMISTRF